MIKFLRIFSHVTAFPALLIFFYVIIKTLDPEDTAYSGWFPILIAVIILIFPITFNRIAWFLDRGTRAKR